MRSLLGRRSSRVRALAAIALCGVAVACSSNGSSSDGSSSNSTSSPFTDKSSSRHNSLVAGAKAEGTLNWYTSLAGQIVQAQVEGFNRLYPSIKVHVYRAAENDVVTRITQETQAGKHAVDITEVTEAAALQLKEDGLLAPFYSSELANIPDKFVDKASNGLANYASDRLTYISLAYNTTKIPAEAVPKTVTDLLNPALKGKFSIETSTTGVRWVAGVLHVLGEEKGTEFLKMLAKQQAPRAQDISGAAMMGLIASGEVAIGPAFNSHAAQEKAKGAPIVWTGIPPIIANQGVEMVFKDAPDPNAAMLFMDYMLGPGSAKVWKENQYSTPGEKVNFEPWSPEKEAGTVEAYNDKFTKWQDLFNELFG